MQRSSFRTFIAACVATPACLAAAAPPEVHMMPDGIRAGTTDTAYAWAGQSIDVWGNVTWGSSTTGTYVLDFGDGTPGVAGTVTNAKNIGQAHAYAAAGTYYPTLTVQDGAAQTGTATARIDVLASSDRSARVNLGIERGLKWLYLNQYAAGNWGQARTDMAAYYPTTTALSVLAFENKGHLPTGDSTRDIYVPTVRAGFSYLCGAIRYSSDIRPQNAGSPDTHGIYPAPATPDGYMVDVPSARSNYEHGIVMLAFAGAGSYRGGDPYDAGQNPALNLIGTIPRQGGGTIALRYYDILANMIDYVAWAQADSGGGRGGWRYSGNEQDSDTSVAQWPAIGCEAAEGWGLFAPAFVKNELLNYWIPYTFYDGGTWGAWAYQYRTDSGTWNVTHGGSGLCMLAWCGVPRTDPRIPKTLAWLDTNWAGNGSWYPWNLHMQGGSQSNYYAMYAIAKGCRISRDAAGKVSEITMIGSRDWYDLYVTHILGQQRTDGSWMTTMSGYHSYWLNTPLAILVLEPTIASLKPIAVVSASPNPTPANQPVAFTIASSYHQDPAKWLTSWQLDYQNDGVPDASGIFPVGGPIVLAAGYPDTGADRDVTAMLRVTDNVGATDDKTVTVRVTSGNVPPVAVIAGPISGSVGVPIVLNGTGSYDPNAGPPLNDTIVAYEWDINGDGVYGDLTGPSPSQTWTTPYVGKIYLRVRDSFGLTGVTQAGVTITVTDLWPVAYPVVSKRRITTTLWEYTFRFELENRGTGGATALSATLNNWPSNVSVVDGAVSWPAVPPGAKVVSTDTFILRMDRSVSVPNSSLTWILKYTDPGGNQQTLVNFPLFP